MGKKRRPDFVIVLMAVFGLGVVATFVLPTAASRTVAAPASELHAGIIIPD